MNSLTIRMDHIENRDSWMIGKSRGIDSLGKGQWEILKYVWIEYKRVLGHNKKN